MLQPVILNLAFYHHTLLDGLKLLHPACPKPTFVGLYGKSEPHGHHLLPTAA